MMQGPRHGTFALLATAAALGVGARALKKVSVSSLAVFRWQERIYLLNENILNQLINYFIVLMRWRIL